MQGKAILNTSVKIAIAGLLLWAIYVQVFAREHLSEIWASFKGRFQFPVLAWLLAAIALMPLNLSFEALKWRQLAKGFSSIGFWRIMKSVLAGLTLAIFTPNRVGEYGGRVLFVEEGQGWKAFIATMVGNVSQLLIILSFGMAGALIYSHLFLQAGSYILTGVSMLSLCFLLLLYAVYFNIDLLVLVARRLPPACRFRPFFKHLAVLRHYSTRDLGISLLLAFCRYATYATQYYLLLKFYGIGAGWLLAMAGIAAIFMMQASIPLPPVLGLMARGELALFIWGRFSNSPVDILAATFSLFVINLAIPAICGLVFIARVNFARKLGIEKSQQ
jgi:hypothetical protein